MREETVKIICDICKVDMTDTPLKYAEDMETEVTEVVEKIFLGKSSAYPATRNEDVCPACNDELMATIGRLKGNKDENR